MSSLDKLCGCAAVALGTCLVVIALNEIRLRALPNIQHQQMACGSSRYGTSAKQGTITHDREAYSGQTNDVTPINDTWLNENAPPVDKAQTTDNESLSSYFQIDGTDGQTWTATSEETKKFEQYTLDKDVIKKQVNVRSFNSSREKPRYTKNIGSSTSIAHQLYGRSNDKPRNVSTNGVCFGGNDAHWNAVKDANNGVAVLSCGVDSLSCGVDS